MHMEFKAWRLVIRVKRSDQLYGKSVEKTLIDLLRANKIWGATVWSGVNGFGKRGKSVKKVEGITFDSPIMIEVIDEKKVLEPLLVEIRQIVGDNGLVTLQEVGII
jgi:PII-like signaling protein